MRHLLAITLGALLLVCASAEFAPVGAQVTPATKVKVTIVKGDRVYHPRSLTTVTTGKVVEKVKPALVDSKRIFDATPEYKRIADENIKKGTAEHKLLVTAASRRFKNAIRRVISLNGYDLVAETGAVTVAGKTLPDITKEVIDNLL